MLDKLRHAQPPGAAASAASGSPPLGPPGTPPPFAGVLRDAKRIAGPLVFWQREDKFWIELAPEQFDKPMLLQPKVKRGVGEGLVLGGLPVFPVNGAGGAQIVEFQRVHNQVRLLVRNREFVAPAGSPAARAVAAAYPDSLLAAVPVVSQPHPERKSVLVEANPLFLSDIGGVQLLLQRSRLGHQLDRGNSQITAVRHHDGVTVVETLNHYFGGVSAAPQSPLAALLGTPPPAVARFAPDPRSLLLGLHYALAPLPPQPMAPRRADPRVGLFTSTVFDLGDDLAASPRQRHVNRWRLDKQDPAAPLSPPVKPIRFVVDRNVPLAYRDTVRDAILEWNKAFERIGFKDAISVRQQGDDEAGDTLDFGQVAVRWMAHAEPLFGAIGPSQVDPRSGEILDATVAIEAEVLRAQRSLRSRWLAPGAVASAFARIAGPALDLDLGLGADGAAAAGAAAAAAVATDAGPAGWRDAAWLMRCQHGELAAEQLGYALDLLAARGDIAPDGPEAAAFLQGFVRELVMHEVGHALGLRHNFRASRAYTEAQLADPAFTREHGIAGSVMEYSPINLPAPGARGGLPFQHTLGPYDLWAIEYAYRPAPPPGDGADAAAAAQAERAMLQAVAARSAEPQLAFGTDEDHFAGLDPEAIQMDLGNDPLAFAGKRLAIARDLLRRQETRELPADTDYAVLRRSLGFALADASRAAAVLARQIGGLRTLRDFPGSGREPLQPVAAEVQRAALDLLMREVLAPDALRISPALQRRLAPDYLDRAESPAVSPDYAMPLRLLELQRAVQGYLLHDAVAARVLDTAAKVDRPQQALRLAEVYERLLAEVWAELKPPRGRPVAVDPLRRELQRDQVRRLSQALLKPSPFARADARSLLRVQARQLLARLEAAARRPGADAETRAHLAEAAETLRGALRAGPSREAG